MYRFTIGEKNHSEEAVLCLRNQGPATYSAVGLYHFFDGRPHSTFDPFVANYSTIASAPQRIKVESRLHFLTGPKPAPLLRCSLTIELSGQA